MPLELLHTTNASAFYCFMGTMLRARGLTEVNAELIGILIETMHLFTRTVPTPLNGQSALQVIDSKKTVLALYDAFEINTLSGNFEKIKRICSETRDLERLPKNYQLFISMNLEPHRQGEDYDQGIIDTKTLLHFIVLARYVVSELGGIKYAADLYENFKKFGCGGLQVGAGSTSRAPTQVYESEQVTRANQALIASLDSTQKLGLLSKLKGKKSKRVLVERSNKKLDLLE